MAKTRKAKTDDVLHDALDRLIRSCNVTMYRDDLTGLAEKIERKLARGDARGAVLLAIGFGASLQAGRNWPAIGKRLHNKAEAEKTKAERDARKAHELLEKERAEAGRYFDLGEAVKSIASTLDVTTKTVKSRLDWYRKNLADKGKG